MNKYAAVMNPARASWYAKIIRKQGSRRLYIHLSYFGEIICRTTGLPDTQENRDMLEAKTDKINREIASGHFVFEKAFPNAPEEERRYFSELEGRSFRPRPEEVTFGRVFEEWKQKALQNLPSDDARQDNLSALESRIIPWFQGYSVDKITPEEVKTFFRALAYPTEETNGVFTRALGENTRVKLTPLKHKRLRTILGAMRRVWKFACEQYNWSLGSPFEGINIFITEITEAKTVERSVAHLSDEELNEVFDAMEEESVPDEKIQVLLMSEVQRVLGHMHPLYRPAAELMLLTGMIASEVAALRNAPVGGHLLIRNSLSRNRLKNKPKNAFRIRRFPVTTAIRRVLWRAAQNASGTLLFRQVRGGYFNEKVFRDAWYRACDAAGVPRAVPYSLRHTFVANCEVLGVPKNRLVALMGHADKSMVDRVYGPYREGIEHECDLILAFYGEDFVAGKGEAALSSLGSKAAS